VQDKEIERKKLGSELDRYTAFCIVRHWAAKFIETLSHLSHCPLHHDPPLECKTAVQGKQTQSAGDPTGNNTIQAQVTGLHTL